MTTIHRGVDISVEGEREIKSPAQIMSPVRRSHLVKGLLISCVAHALLIGLTSFSLYADWMQFGIKMPQELKALKKQMALAELDAERETARQGNPARPESKGASAVGPEASPASSVPGEVPNVVRDASGVRTERPTASRLNLNEELGLD